MAAGSGCSSSRGGRPARGLGGARARGLGRARAIGIGEARARGLGRARAIGIGEARALGLGGASAPVVRGVGVLAALTVLSALAVLGALAGCRAAPGAALAAAGGAAPVTTGGATPAAAAPAVDHPPARTGLLRELAGAEAVLSRYYGKDDFPTGPDRPERQRALDAEWSIAARWTAAFLTAHPAAATSPSDIEADLRLLAKHQRGDFDPSAVRLAGAGPRSAAVAVALADGFRGGTFFVVAETGAPGQAGRMRLPARQSKRMRLPARQSERFVPAWSIATIVGGAGSAGWSYSGPAIHDGPFAGRVSPLPPARSGRPRFLVQAVAEAVMGLDVPRQVGVWEWTGSAAVPELVTDYLATDYRLDHPLEGDLLRLPTKEETQVFYTCGSCEEPRGTWTLRITPDGVTDLGHTPEDPLLLAADRLFDRIARRQDAAALAAPAVLARLRRFVAALQADRAPVRPGNPPPDPEDGVRGLSTWHLRTAAGRRILEIDSDWTGHLALTFARRAGTDYVTGVALP